MRKDFSKICVSPDDSIKNALGAMAKNKPQDTLFPAGIVLVTDKSKKLLGIATDGDIRRALAHNASVNSSIMRAINKRPFLVEGPKSDLEILSLVVDKVRKEHWHKDRLDKIILVDKNKRLLDLLSFYDLWQQSDTRFKHVGVVGLGYVGLTLALTLADLGFKVKGFDTSSAVKNSLNAGKPHFFEAGLESLLKDHIGRSFQLVNNFNGANNCDVYFVAVGTPLDGAQKPNLSYLERATKNLGRVLKYGDTIILRSTVPLGTTRNFVLPILEKESGFKAGEGFFLAFAPERTVQGKAVAELKTLPQIIGGVNRRSIEIVAGIFGFVTRSTVLVDSLEEAEMIKLINNTYRDVNFGFANEVSLVAQKWGMDANKIIQAANYGYERSNVPSPSPGVGGYCLEKDPFIFIESARSKGYDPVLARHARAVSDTMVDFISNEISTFLKNHKSGIKFPKILALGLAFKGRPVTSDTRGSTGLGLLKKLQAANFSNIYGYDPAVPKNDFLINNIKYVRNAEAGFRSADAVLVLTNHPDFELMNMRRHLLSANKPVLFFDSWGLFNKEDLLKIKGIHYRRL